LELDAKKRREKHQWELSRKLFAFGIDLEKPLRDVLGPYDDFAHIHREATLRSFILYAYADASWTRLEEPFGGYIGSLHQDLTVFQMNTMAHDLHYMLYHNANRSTANRIDTRGRIKADNLYSPTLQLRYDSATDGQIISVPFDITLLQFINQYVSSPVYDVD